MNSTQHVNAEVIQELRLVMGDEFSALVQTFGTDSEERISAIAAAVAAGDADALRRSAHSFKGSAGNMGAEAMADLCCRLEELGRSGTTAGGAELLAQLREEFVRVQHEFDDLAR